jgi:hypothetical protein
LITGRNGGRDFLLALFGGAEILNRPSGGEEGFQGGCFDLLGNDLGVLTEVPTGQMVGPEIAL